MFQFSLLNVQFLILFSLISFVTAFAFPIDADNVNCRLDSTRIGVCKVIYKCATAITMLKLTRWHTLPRCGFSANDEIVCCPDEIPGLTENRRVTDASTGPVWDEEKLSPSAIPITTQALPVEVVTEPSAVENKPDVNVTDKTSPYTNISRSQIACFEYNNEIAIKPTLLIINGDDAENGEFPHMAAIGYNVDNEIKYQCGGTVISDSFVVTAAHCVLRNDEIRPSVVRLGEVDLSLPGVQYEVEESIMHPEYRRPMLYNDIALLRLKNRITYTSNIQPACLYNKNDEPQGLIVTGWGVIDLLTIDTSNILQKATLSPVKTEECNTTYERQNIGARLNRGIIDSMMCAYSTRSDACHGDSGGPLQVQLMDTPNIWSIIGVTSFGIGCGGNVPGVYIRISRYIDWIENIVWPS